jgi:type VI secretion system protein ImpM
VSAVSPSPAAEPQAGAYGKVPTHGDFVTRGLGRPFVEPWDRWLQGWLADGRNRLGPRFEEAFLRAPVWRYLLGPRLCGPNAWAGVLAPSSDRVGRAFPLTVALPVEADDDPFRLVDEWSEGFLLLERAALGLLDGSLALDRIEAELATLASIAPLPPPYRPPNLRWRARQAGQPADAVRVAIADVATPIVARDVVTAMLSDPAAPASFWWHTGLEGMEPAALFCRGLPAAGTLPPFLDGGWTDWGFEAQAGQGGPPS